MNVVCNDNAISCRGWGTGSPLAQAGGVCVYIESAPHAIVRQKPSAPHPRYANKAPHAGLVNKA
jgi:hypothetical protein